jgi:hypothetical protein
MEIDSNVLMVLGLFAVVLVVIVATLGLNAWMNRRRPPLYRRP